MNDFRNLRFECTRCGNCCTDKETLVNLTYLDILRIKKELKLNLKEVIKILGFYIFERKLTQEDKTRMVIEPIKTEKGLAFLALRKSSLGGCYFYNSSKKKCLIYKIRPLFCRTFPFSFGLLNENYKQTIKSIEIKYAEKGKQYCPGINKNAPLIDYDSYLKLGKKALEELEKNFKVIKEWNNLAKKGVIVPTVEKFLLTIFKLNDS